MSIPHAGFLGPTNRLFFITLVVTIGLLMLDSVLAESSRAGTGEVIAIRECKLKAGIDTVKFERFVIEKYNPTMEGAIPGVRSFVTKADRGQKKGGYAHFFIFDSYKTWHAIVPEEGKMADWFKPFWEKVDPVWTELKGYLEEGSLAIYSDYVVLR